MARRSKEYLEGRASSEGKHVREIVNEVLEQLDRGEDLAVVRIVSVMGSTPRAAGAEMLVRRDGSIAGTIGGGLLEATMMREAAAAIAARRSWTTSFALTGTDVTSAERMVCGGAAEVLIAYVEPGRPSLRDVMRAVRNVVGTQGEASLVAALTDDGQVDFWLLSKDGAMTGSPPAPVAELQAPLHEAMRGGPATLADGRRIFVETIEPADAVVICGAGHVGAALVPICSSVGFHTVVVDDRPDFASRERLPGADEIIVSESFQDAFTTIDVRTPTYIVIATRGHTHDLAVLRAALRTPAAYIGLMASRIKRSRIFDALRAEGFTEGDIARIHSPIGVSIGAETPAELAVSIVAEMIAVRADAEVDAANSVSG